MNKQEFLAELRRGFSGLPEKDREERLTFYSEMIDDRMEDGIPEETAVLELGTVEELVSQAVAAIPLGKLVKEKIMPKRKMKAWEIILLVLGSPVWLPLLLAAFAVILSLYAVLWSVVAVLWAAFASVAVCGPAFITAGVFLAFNGNGLTGLAAAGAGTVCAGISVFLFFGCRETTKGITVLTKKLAVGIRNCFIKKKEA